MWSSIHEVHADEITAPSFSTIHPTEGLDFVDPRLILLVQTQGIENVNSLT